MNTAYLFDIDGTLLKIKNRANRRIIQSILDRFGISAHNVAELDFAGKTDRAIFSTLLDDPPEPLFNEIKDIYLQELDNHLSEEDIHMLDGVSESLDYLSGQSAATGLLTGNFEIAARIKLDRIGLNSHFLFGAFGDRHHDRNDLPPAARKNLQEQFSGDYPPEQLVIIGDTPRDIRCAHHFGSVAVAVATGAFSRDELARYHPHALLSSLEEFPEWDQAFFTSNEGG